VSEQGSGSARTVRLDAGGGNAFEGPLGPDGSFELSAPLPGGAGTQALSGRFTVSGSAVTLSGTGTVSSGDVTCNLTFAAERAP
jgi:hypothetical protein